MIGLVSYPGADSGSRDWLDLVLQHCQGFRIVDVTRLERCSESRSLLLIRRELGVDPVSQGSQILFDKLIEPTIKPWEGTCDFVGFVLSEILEITIHCLLIVPRWIARKWRGGAAEPDVSAVLSISRKSAN